MTLPTAKGMALSWRGSMRSMLILKFLRPSKVVAEAIVIPVKDQWLNDLIDILSHEVTTQGGKSFVLIFIKVQLSLAFSILPSNELW